ncbi:uncharacterized protein C8A04DRAFT_32900 [Dichotomopilus funicola]|uniref:NAD(P)-binding domain-containing protein n=1 Tax=Dichotomopilus funicola TaxID=1934379 RepID=A0AAN6ZJ12_9PEZI|nr:hypothetical protein C8A04DRAFT_32900 [Dichotomopilus funicola]
MAPAPHHVLLLGGHGKISQLLTPLLLRRGWDVTSVIRAPEQVATIEGLANASRGDGDAVEGKLNVLVRSLEEVESEGEAKDVVQEVGADFVVWSAGAGGKGGPDRTNAIDRDAATHFIHASTATPKVTRFLMVSYLASRRARPAWWSDDAWAAAEHVNQLMPHYYRAKLAADEALYLAAKNRPGFAAINLRPGTLTLDPAGPVELGKTVQSRGNVSRETVARVADLLLASEGVGNTWLDLVGGEEDTEKAVERVVREGVNAAEGEEIF